MDGAVRQDEREKEGATLGSGRTMVYAFPDLAPRGNHVSLYVPSAERLLPPQFVWGTFRHMLCQGSATFPFAKQRLNPRNTPGLFQSIPDGTSFINEGGMILMSQGRRTSYPASDRTATASSACSPVSNASRNVPPVPSRMVWSSMSLMLMSSARRCPEMS